MNLVIEILAYICECITMLLCIYSYLNKKFTIDYNTILLIVSMTTVLVLVMELELSGLWTFANQLLIFVYIWWEFGLRIKHNFILMMLNFVTNVSVQAIIAITSFYILKEVKSDRIAGLVTNIIALCIMLIITRVIVLNKLYVKLIAWDKVIIRILLICAMLMVFMTMWYKIGYQVDTISYTIAGIMVACVIVILFRWQQDRYEIKRKNLEIKMNKLYGDAFEEIIDNIRIRQHGIKNQYAAVMGMQYSIQSGEQMVKAQKEYRKKIEEEGKFDQILTMCCDKVLAGFLFTKFLEIDKSGACIQYNVNLVNGSEKISTYELVEIIGVLLDNAVEYIDEHKECKVIYFQLTEEVSVIEIVCRNQAEYIPLEKIGKLFEKGYSSKGSNRGLGLYTVKKLLKEKGEIVVSNKEVDNLNWIEFKIEISK